MTSGGKQEGKEIPLQLGWITNQSFTSTFFLRTLQTRTCSARVSTVMCSDVCTTMLQKGWTGFTFISLPPLFNLSSFFWAAWTFSLMSFWLLQLCKMILNGHLDNGRALLSLIAPDDDQWGAPYKRVMSATAAITSVKASSVHSVHFTMLGS